MNRDDYAVGGAGAPPPLAYLARRAARFWLSAGVLFVVVFGASVYYAKQTWQPYQSQAVLMFDQSMPREMGTVDMEEAGGRLSKLLLETSRIRQLVEKHDLFPEYSKQRAVEEVKRRLSFEPQLGGTYQVAYVGFSPQEAQTVLKDVTESLVADHNNLLGKQVEQTHNILAQESAELEKMVAARENDINTFIRKHPDVATVADQDAQMNPSLILLQEQLRQALQDREAGRVATSPAGSSQALLAKLSEAETARDQARRTLEEEQATKTAANPDVIRAREVLGSAQADVDRLAAEVRKVSAAGSAGAAAGDSTIESLKRQIANLQSQATRARTKRDPKTLQLAEQLTGLRQELVDARERLARLRDKEISAGVTKNMERSGVFMNLQVHDPAALPGSPQQSRRRRIAMAGFAVAGLLALGLALGRAVLSGRVFDRQDVAQMLGAGVLAVVPKVPKGLRSSPRG